MANTWARTKYDTFAKSGIGFPGLITLLVLGTYGGAVTNVDAFFVPTNMTTAEAGHNAGAAMVVTKFQIHAQTPGDRTTGNYQYRLQKIDSAGTVLETLATVTLLPAHAGIAEFSLLSLQGVGRKLEPGTGLRLDTVAAVPTGGATTAANIKVRVFVETFGIAG